MKTMELYIAFFWEDNVILDLHQILSYPYVHLSTNNFFKRMVNIRTSRALFNACNIHVICISLRPLLRQFHSFYGQMYNNIFIILSLMTRLVHQKKSGIKRVSSFASKCYNCNLLFVIVILVGIMYKVKGL